MMCDLFHEYKILRFSVCSHCKRELVRGRLYGGSMGWVADSSYRLPDASFCRQNTKTYSHQPDPKQTQTHRHQIY